MCLDAVVLGLNAMRYIRLHVMEACKTRVLEHGGAKGNNSCATEMAQPA